ncbi:MAG: hypothetical protein HY784_16165 [Chloroflexi bacterium]|nr:hypothetical protein [Chloroflexota bacterium]
MGLAPSALESTLENIRERAWRLEREAAALRSDLDEVSVVLNWNASKTVSAVALRRIAVGETEIRAYGQRLGEEHPAAVLRLVLQAQKVATRLKQTVTGPEQEPAIRATLAALTAAADALGLTVPPELEAVIGD